MIIPYSRICGIPQIIEKNRQIQWKGKSILPYIVSCTTTILFSNQFGCVWEQVKDKYQLVKTDRLFCIMTLAFASCVRLPVTFSMSWSHFAPRTPQWPLKTNITEITNFRCYLYSTQVFSDVDRNWSVFSKTNLSNRFSKTLREKK